MIQEKLLQLRNELVNAPLGDILLEYLQDFITKESCKLQADNSKELKGMCQIVQQIKDIPQIVESNRK